MGDFGGQSIDSNTLLSGAQHKLLKPLSSFFLQEIANAKGISGDIQSQLIELQKQLTSDTSAQSRQLAQDIFQKGLIDPALATFQRDVAPSIQDSFARIGGALSSRVGTTTANALTDITKNAEAELARQLPTIENFPLQQTLEQIGGLNQIQSTALAPISQAIQFAVAQTVQNQVTQNSNILGDVLGAAGSIGGAKAGQGLSGFDLLFGKSKSG